MPQGFGLASVCGKIVQNRPPVLLLWQNVQKQAYPWEFVTDTPHAHHPGLSCQAQC